MHLHNFNTGPGLGNLFSATLHVSKAKIGCHKFFYL